MQTQINYDKSGFLLYEHVIMGGFMSKITDEL